MVPNLILAPLRGVTIRSFRETFAAQIDSAGFEEAITPFITAIDGFDPIATRNIVPSERFRQKVTPQFIGKSPEALKQCLLKVLDFGCDTADLNCGCPYPMVRNKGRGSGLLGNPDLLERMIAAGCEVMGSGFSVKARLGISGTGELLKLMPVLNRYPLRFLTVHARTARQMYDGACDRKAFGEIVRAAKMPVVYNGDAAVGDPGPIMVGRSFIRSLGNAEDASLMLRNYIEMSVDELSGDRPVLGRIKELLTYWKDIPRWSRIWPLAKLTRTVPELYQLIS